MIGKLPGVAVGLSLAIACGAVRGQANLGVEPLRIDIAQPARSGSLRVTNRGTEAVRVQADLRLWTQQEGRDKLEETSEAVASPPLFELQPGASQVLRVGLLRPADPARETTYRLLVSELPRDKAVGMQTLIRLSMPVFVVPAVKPPAAAQADAPRLEWRARRVDGRLEVRAANAGARHVQVANAACAPWFGAAADSRLTGYVLAGQWRSWSLPAPDAAAECALEYQVNRAPQTARLRLDP